MIELEGDLEEPLVEALESASGLPIGESASVHFKEVTGGSDCLANARRIGAVGAVGNGQNGRLMRPGRVLASLVELALQILLRDLHVAHGHADIVVSQQFHESGEADTEAEHLRSEAVPQTVRRDGAGAACNS